MASEVKKKTGVSFIEPINRLWTLIFVLAALIILYWKIFAPKDETSILTMRDIRPDLLEQSMVVQSDNIKITTPSERMTYSPVLSYLIGIMFLVYLYYHFIEMKKLISSS